jgi:aromatic ring-opening dioxygenase catalytic subunit (LigB family)
VNLPFAFLAPHRPTLVLDEHRRHRTPMLEALARAAGDLALAKPDVIVALSTRWNAPGPFRVDDGRRHHTLTDYPGLGVELRYDCDGQPALARAAVEAGRAAGLRVAAASHGADSGVTVPLHFLVPARQIPVVPLSLSPQDARACRRWGEVLRAVLEAWPGRAGFIAGGLLSCNEHAWNLRREVPEAKAFDEATLAAMECGAWDEIDLSNRSVRARARPEAGLRHLEVLRGFAGPGVRAVVRCYEGSNGVGAALIEFPLVAPRLAERPPTN